MWWWCVCFLWICMLEKVTHVSGRLLPFHTWAVFPPVKLPWLHLKKKQTKNQWINNKNRTFRTINISVPVFLPLSLSLSPSFSLTFSFYLHLPHAGPSPWAGPFLSDNVTKISPFEFPCQVFKCLWGRTKPWLGPLNNKPKARELLSLSSPTLYTVVKFWL